MKKNESVWYSAGGVLAVFLILVLANFVLSSINSRIDLTEGKVYTLSEGTRQVLLRYADPDELDRMANAAALERRDCGGDARAEEVVGAGQLPQ